MIVLDRTEIGWSPLTTHDPFTALVYSVHGHQVCDTMVDGTWLLRNRQWQTIDYTNAVQRQSADAQRLIALRDAQNI